MATLKICTHDRTQWITDVYEVVLAQSFSVKHFDNPLVDCDCPDAVLRGQDLRVTTVVDFQAPDPDNGVRGDDVGNVLWVRRVGEHDYTHRVVAPARSCFLMSDGGKTIDRI